MTCHAVILHYLELECQHMAESYSFLSADSISMPCLEMFCILLRYAANNVTDPHDFDCSNHVIRGATFTELDSAVLCMW